MYPKPTTDETQNKISLRMPCAHTSTVIRMPCANTFTVVRMPCTQGYTLYPEHYECSAPHMRKIAPKCLFSKVLCFPLEKCSKNPITAKPSFLRRFTEHNFDSVQKDEIEFFFANCCTILNLQSDKFNQ